MPPALMLVTAPAARAEVGAADPIDAGMRACLARADRSSTAGQIQCMDAARTGWQAAIDSAYAQLLAKTPPAQRGRWVTSQQRWNAWRDMERPLVNAAFAHVSGAMYAQSEADLRLQPVRNRALMLRTQAALAQANVLPPRVPPCLADARCEHTKRDLDYYDHQLLASLPASARATFVQAQRAWRAYRDVTLPLIDANARLDLIGVRLATLKRLADTAGHPDSR